MSPWGILVLGLMIGFILGFGSASMFKLGAESDTRIRPAQPRDERQ